MQATEERAEPRTAVGSIAWKALESHYKKVRKLHLRKLFADDPTRGERLTASATGIELDYSKNRVTDETLELLIQLANEAGLRERIDAMFSGSKINITENRAVLHTALRAPAGASVVVDGQNVVPQVHDVLRRMADFSTRVRNGAWKGQTGKRKGDRGSPQPARHRRGYAHVIRPTGACSIPRAGSESLTPGRGPRGCSGPAREPKILRRRTFFTSKLSPLPSP